MSQSKTDDKQNPKITVEKIEGENFWIRSGEGANAKSERIFLPLGPQNVNYSQFRFKVYRVEDVVVSPNPNEVWVVISLNRTIRGDESNHPQVYALYSYHLETNKWKWISEAKGSYSSVKLLPVSSNPDIVLMASRYQYSNETFTDYLARTDVRAFDTKSGMNIEFYSGGERQGELMVWGDLALRGPTDATSTDRPAVEAGEVYRYSTTGLALMGRPIEVGDVYKYSKGDTIAMVRDVAIEFHEFSFQDGAIHINRSLPVPLLHLREHVRGNTFEDFAIVRDDYDYVKVLSDLIEFEKQPN